METISRFKLDVNRSCIKYGNLYAISSLFNSITHPKSPIIKEHSFLSLENKELKNDQSITTDLLRFDLLKVLLEEHSFSESSSIIIGNKSYSNLISQISMISTNCVKGLITALLESVHLDGELINFVDKIFPYQKLKSTEYSMICYWIPLCKLLFSKGINFTVTIDDKIIKFNEALESDFSLEIILNQPNSFSLTSALAKYKGHRCLRITGHVEEHSTKNDLIFYSITSKIAENPSKLDDKDYMSVLKTKSKKELKSDSIKAPSMNSILSLKELFINKDVSLIGYIWNIIYALPENEIIEISKIIHPIESKILISAASMFKLINKNTYNGIINWNKWVSYFEDQAKVLWDLSSNEENSLKDLSYKEKVDIINDTIEYLNKSEQMNYIWSAKEFIEQCKKELNQINKKETDIQKIEIKNKIEKLKTYLINQKVQAKYEPMKMELANNIGSITEFTQEKLNCAKIIVQQFINDANSQWEDIKGCQIIWPYLNFNDFIKGGITENIKLFETLIWYSQIDTILQEINKGKDLMKNLWKLNDFKEMNSSREILFSHLIKNAKKDKSGLTIKDKKQALYTLNAHMLMKLYNINISFLSDPDRITKSLNKYMNRNAVDEREILWIHQKLSEYSPDLNLTIPKFEPNDLVFMIINRGSDSNYQNGPLMAGITKNLLLEDFEDLMFRDFDDFKDAAKSIGKIIYMQIISPDEDAPKDYEMLKQSFYHLEIPDSKEAYKYEIARKAQKIFEFAEFLENWKDQKLLFDDIAFLSEDWTNDNNLLNKYPSLLFWICKNRQCCDQLISLYGKFIPKPNKIPFWLLILRILSSNECVTFDNKANITVLAEIIKDITSNCIKEFLHTMSDKELNYDWMNILLSNLPSKFVNPFITVIHDFFVNLSMDDKELYPELINELKNRYIRDSILNVTTFLLSNKSNELMTGDINSEDSNIQFLAFPSKFIQNKINESSGDIAKSIIYGEATVNLRKYLSSNSLEALIQNLQDAINEDQRNMIDKCEEKFNQEKEERIEKKIRNIKLCIEQYNEIINEFVENKVKHREANEKVRSLQKYQEKLHLYLNMFNEEGIVLSCLSYSSWDDVCIDIMKGDKEKKVKLKKAYHGIQFLLPNETFDLEKNKDNLRYHEVKLEAPVEFKFINEDFDFNTITVESSYEILMPKMTFGVLSLEVFIDKLHQLLKALNSFDEEFVACLENQNTITILALDFIDNINNVIYRIRSNFRVEFSDHSPCPNTDNVLQRELSNYLDYIYPLVTKINDLTQRKLKPIWKVLNMNTKFYNLFKFQYDIQIPEIAVSKRTPDFSNIKNINSLASPIISLLPENKFICSVNKLRCQIGPIFQSNIYDPYSINIISFIEGEVYYKIENLSDPEFASILSTKEKVNKNDPIQIFVRPPPPSKNEPEIIKMEGDIVIKKNSVEPYTLPFEITLGIVPLKVRLRCLEYKLAEQNKNLRLCCDKIHSGSKINFEIINYYINDHFLVAVELESLDENESSKPELYINKEKQQFQLTMPTIKEPKHGKFIIKIALSQKTVVSILCDLIILPLVSSFEVYDYITKEFTTECKLIYLPEKSYPLYFRIISPFPCKQLCKIQPELPFCVKASINDKEITNKLSYRFQLEGDLFFMMKISFDFLYNIDNFPSSYNRYNISLDIGTIRSKIFFNFVKLSSLSFHPYKFGYSYENDQYLKKYPTCKYNYKTGKWEIVAKNEDLKKNYASNLPYFICSPFNFYTDFQKFTSIDYNTEDYAKVLNAENFIFLQFTKTDNQKWLTNENNKTTEKSYKMFKQLIYYTVVGYDQYKEDLWFPAFSKYPDLTGMKAMPYQPSPENMKKIENNTDKMLKSLHAYDFIIANKSKLDSFFISTTKNFLKQKNYAVFMLLLDQAIILNDPLNFISLFPQSIQLQLSNFINEFDLFKSSEEEITIEIQKIISYNLKIAFAQVFAKKYAEIESHMFCLQCPLVKNDIVTFKNAMLNRFFNYDKSKEQKRSDKIELLFAKNEKAIKNISIEELPENSEQKECFIISENEPPKACELKDELGSFKFDEKEKHDDSIILDTMESFASLPKIELPSSFSITSLNTFYSRCSQGSNALPAYILFTHIQKKDQKYSEMYFSILLSIYQKLTTSSSTDRSILASHVNSFIESFQNCVKRLNKAGVDFGRLRLSLNINDRKNNLQDFIKSPMIEKPLLLKTQWKSKSKVSEYYTKYRDPFYNKGTFGVYDYDGDKYGEDYSFKYPTKRDEAIKKEEPQVVHTEIGTEEKNLIIAKVIGENGGENDDEDEDNNLFNDLEMIEADKKTTLKVVDESSMKTVDTSGDDINGLFPQFSEVDSIERVLRRIKQMKSDDKLKFLNSNECVIQNQNELFRSTATDFPVKELIDQSQNLIANLISKASDMNCPYPSMSCNLLIDCSSFISYQNKLYNFMLVIAFSYALSAIEVPFSIAIVADKNFRFVLKPFEEEISILVLQRILDCLFILRYKTNLADTIFYSTKFMKCPDENRNQRAIFLFSNGLDENLVLSQSWKETLLNDPNNSFGLIFVKSQLFDNEKYAIIQNMWNNFNEVVKTAPSITRLITINPDVNKNTFELISNIFAAILARPETEVSPKIKNKADIKPEFITNYTDLTKESFNIIKGAFSCTFDSSSSSIFRNINYNFTAQGTRFQKLDIAYYRNKTDKIAIASPDHSIKDEFDQFVHKLVYYKSNLYRPYLEVIFKPNKASQTVLSSTGTDFDITALILNLINPVPDPLIYLEEKGGLIRNYGITIIIDSSRSCFNSLSSSHSYQTIKTLFSALASIDVSCVDVIVARNGAPSVLATEIPSSRLFSDKSSLWPSLFYCLTESCSDGCNLESAIHAAFDIRRLRAVDSTSFMFVLTDGLFQDEQKALIKNHVMSCMQSDISIFGIGIGIYPNGIVDMFPKTIFASNPNDLIRGIASCFGNESNDSFNDTIKHLAPEQCPAEVISGIFEKLIKNENDPIFKDLKNYLTETHHSLDAFSDMYNEEQEARNSNNELVNPDGENTEMYVKDLLKGQKILFMMPYKEYRSEPQYIYKPFSAGDTCVKEALDFYGVEINVVTNYGDAIRELNKQTIPGKCDYYGLWILSGNPGNLCNDPNLLDKFIDCSIQFWNNGGSVVLWADNSPYTVQANKFLEKVVFPDGRKTNLRVNGNNPGEQHLVGDPTGKLDKPATFNKSPIEFKKFNRASLAHNLFDIYEGITLAFANDDYRPFTPFMRDSSGGISCLYYTGDRDPKHRTGDLIVDCGWTKLFYDMRKSGTFRYVQNLAAWTAQCEYNRVHGVNPKNYRPRTVVFPI
ncbi:hypothetical protein M9Y10_016358 [Tritrichomonas musculus]|uniref:Uncharacterized protein n=1 Tax=Tritrichomonas musculus TaxID=1915356 RepID=A0ABR2HW33_9EUKA